MIGVFVYTYFDLMNELPILGERGAEISIIGTSVLGRNIPCIHLGTYAGQQVLIQGAIHAREHITARLVVQLIYYTQDVWPNLNGGIYFIPMMNPDGVSLCQFGVDSVASRERRNFLLEVNGANGTDFTYWKANANAVDLNTNFSARWGTGAENVFSPAPANYVGPYPNSEPETRALLDITLAARPALTISYHARGQEIYWQFHQTSRQLERDRRIAQNFALETGYTLINGERGSAGGYKDWCIEALKIPAFTFETVSTNFPYPIDYAALEEEFPRNRNIPKSALNTANGLIGL